VPRSQVDIDILTHLGSAISELGKMQQAMVGLGNESQQTGSKLDRTKQRLGAMGPAATKAFATASAAITGSTLAFASYETQLKNVQNISGQTDAEMAQMTQRFMDLPPTLGEADDLMRGLYQTISSGVTDADAAFEVVVNSAKAAKGNLADMTVTVDGLTSILNAYKLESSESMAVLDAMTKTVDLGKLTFEELASNIGKGISIAAAADVSYQELLATLATLTLNGLSVEESMTGIRNILNTVLKPTKEVTDNLEAMGLHIDATTLKNDGLAATMAKVASRIGDNNEMVTMFFPNIRAMNGAMALASEEGGAKLDDTMQQIMESAGKVESNFSNMSSGTQASFDALVAQTKKAGIAFGELTSEALLPLMNVLTDFMQTLTALDEPERRLIANTTALVAAISGGILIAPKVIAGFQAISAAFITTSTAAGTATRSIKAFNVAMGLAVAAGLALQYGINKLAEHIDKTSAAMNEASIETTKQAKAFQDAMTENGAKLSVYAQQLGVTATAEEGLGEALRKRMLELRGQGKLTAEQEKVLKSYVDNLKGARDATDDLEEAEQDHIETQQDLAEALAESGELLAAMKQHGEEWEKAQKKLKDGTEDADAAQIAFAESLGQVSIIARDPEPLTGAERRTALYGDSAADAADDVDELTIAVEALNDETGENIKPPPPWSEDWQKALDKISINLKDSLAIAIGDSLFEGFDSVGDWIGGIFESWGETFMDVWRNQVFNGETFSALMSGDMSFADLAGSIAQQGAENPWVYGLGGAASIYSGSQTGGVGGALQGAIGGASMWASLAPLLTGAAATGVGLAIAAVIGGAIALMGSSSPETPFFSAQLGDPMGLTGATGFNVTSSGGHMGLDEESRQVFEQQMNLLVEQTQAGWRDALLMFEDLSLFEMVGDLPSAVFGGMEMSTSEFAEYFGEVWLPDQMQNMFREAIDSGLGNFNVTQQTLDRLWDELGVLPGPDRLQALTDYIEAIIGTAELIEDMQWDSLLDEIGQSPRDAFVEFMRGGLEQIDLMMLGFDEMSLIEQARQANDINALITAARQQEIQYLRQIEQISSQISSSIGSQIEDLRLGGMSEFGQADYISGQLEDIFAQIMGGGLSPDVVSMLVGDAQNYISMLEQIMGEEGLAARLPDVLTDFFGSSAFGNLDELFPQGLPADMTGREFLIALLEQLGTVSEAALEESRQEAQELNDQYIERLMSINERLTGFDGGLEGLAGEGGTIDSTAESMDYLATKSAELGDEFERVTAALGGWDPNYLEDALRERVMINIDPNLAPLIELIEQIVAARTGGTPLPPPGGIY